MKKSNIGLRIIRISQHLLLGFIALIVAYSLAGTTIMLPGVGGNYSYNLYASDRNRSYEDSYLFNNILGNNISDVLRLVAVRSQLEDGGEYTGDKLIDVTAYVNRGTTLSGDYVTAVYKLSDLLKWAQSGFSYEKRNFTEEESEGFLSKSTTYTHLKNNQFSGGMNTYLNSQIDGNSLNFSISGNSSYSGGEHSCLITRYQTVDGKNNEQLVSTWDEYNTLCTYVQDAAEDLLSNYTEYGNAIEYFSPDESNIRYYVSRTINGKNEIYTNLSGLKNGAPGMDLKEIFEDFGRYIYYCPYELEYETNTLIKEKVLRGIIKSYSYAYPDQIKVYIGVDTKNYEAKDAFVLGKKSFGRYMPHKTQLIIAGGVAAFVYLLLLVIYLKSLCPAVAPVQYPEYKGSYIPSERLEVNENVKPPKRPCTELYLLAGLLAVGIPAAAVAFMKQKWGLGTFVRMPVFPFISAVLAMLVDIGILCMIYGIAGKAKSNVVWKDCAFRKLIAFAGDLVANTTGNANVIIRSWIPFIFFLVLNVLLSRAGVLGVIAAVCFDIIVGIYIYRQNLDRDNIIHVIGKIKNGDVKAKADVKNLHGDNISLAEAVNSIGEGIDVAVNTSMKDEKLKADLITNVSHDIKTPLTSIINYVDLIKREDIDNQKVREYVDILDEKSQKLKQLTEDLVEASKISSGNISVNLSRINFVELVNQTIGEFYEKFEKSNLNPIFKPQEPTMEIIADPRHLWRVIENLLNNVCKYALAGTRVYLDMRYNEEDEDEKKVIFSVKNISASELNIDAAELTERFIRGDVSRTTEGSGLGLSIAKNLTLAQDGTFDIRLDGDLFKVTIGFKSPK